ncbi:hypothetical protein BASA81_000558 [Batrachochytrium salamandrivorans]|nr:hypothetical protein BASA81_000558 [Batrachochytrium salamandrivorans]
MEAPKPLDEETVQSLQKAQQLRSKSAQFSQRIDELAIESSEHVRVASTLKEMANYQDRKCFRMVGEVLVERTVPSVVQELEENLARISQAIKNLVEQREQSDKEAQQILTAHAPLLEELGKREKLLQQQQ